MPFHAALDVSLETTSICVVDGEGTIIREGEVATDPDTIAAFLEDGGEPFVRCGIEAGPLSPWLYGELTQRGLMVVCLETRHAKAALGAMRNKTDRNDARGLAQLVRTGWFRAVHVKSTESHELRMLLTSRKLLHGKCLDAEGRRSSAALGSGSPRRSCSSGTIRCTGPGVARRSIAAPRRCRAVASGTG